MSCYHSQPPGAGQAATAGELRPPGLGAVPELQGEEVADAGEGGCLVQSATLGLFVVIDELGKKLYNIFSASCFS